MKVLPSAVALAIVLAIVLAWPAAGEAQSRTTKARGATAAQSQAVHRPAKLRARRAAPAKPCAARTWIGCHGWDPDPNVRMMIQMDAAQDDL